MYLYSETCQSHGFLTNANEKNELKTSSPNASHRSDAHICLGYGCGLKNGGETLSLFNAVVICQRARLSAANGPSAEVTLVPAVLYKWIYINLYFLEISKVTPRV
jgi:hypothetical protein